LLVSKDGTLGVVRLVRTSRVFSIFVSVALVKPIVRSMGDYLDLALSCPQAQAQMTGTGTGLRHIHLKDLRAFAVPVAPAAEQAILVERVRAYLDRIRTLQRLQESGVEALSVLDRSILAKAFRGELVPQEPNDEPVSVWLERIRAQGAGQGKARRGRARRA
jgi:type I restriction enzyme S subunit